MTRTYFHSSAVSVGIMLALVVVLYPAVTMAFAAGPAISTGSDMMRGGRAVRYVFQDTVPITHSKRSLVVLHVARSGQTNPRSSKMARESAVIVEWEPVSELQRRIDEGINYEHWSEDCGSAAGSRPGRRSKRETTFPYGHSATNGHGGAVPTARGVFCGYRTTTEDRVRLKSADPDVVLDDFAI